MIKVVVITGASAAVGRATAYTSSGNWFAPGAQKDHGPHGVFGARS